MPVEFVEEINAQSSTAGNYRSFIERLRVRLGVRSSHNLPALAVQENPPTRFFELVIQTNSRSVRFRLRMDNLYLIGYRMGNGQWLEFNNDDGVHLIPEQGTTFLGFTGHYNDLERVSRTSLTGTGVGHDNLVSSINELAMSTDRITRARYLIVVIMMFCEATRLRQVLTYIADNFQRGYQIESWIDVVIRSWGAFSGALLRADAFPEEPFQIRSNQVTVPNVGNINNLSRIIEIMGILLGLCFRNSRRALAASDEGERERQERQCFLGLPLLQVFSVRIDNIAATGATMYGTITVNDGLNTEYLYNRTSSNPQSISPGQNALLIGPSQSSLAISNFSINLLLTLSRGGEIVNNDIWWYASEIGNLYDQLITQRFVGTNGTATVNYTVLRNSVAATITVTLEGGGGNTSNVYGTLSGRYGNWRDDPNTTSSLFNRSSNDYVVVRRGENIPLSRSVVAVPVDGSLIVTASLYSFNTSSPATQIAIGTAELPAQMSGTTFRQIRTGGNSVRVTVDWSSRI